MFERERLIGRIKYINKWEEEGKRRQSCTFCTFHSDDTVPIDLMSIARKLLASKAVNHSHYQILKTATSVFGAAGFSVRENSTTTGIWKHNLECHRGRPFLNYYINTPNSSAVKTSVCLSFVGEAGMSVIRERLLDLIH